MTLSIAGINRAMRSVGLADESQFFFKLADLPDDTCLVESMQIEHWGFHQDYRIQVKVLLRHRIASDELVGEHATLSLMSASGLMPLHGLIIDTANADGNGDYSGLNLTLASVLSPLKRSQHNRVFVDRSALSVARDILEERLGAWSTVDVLSERDEPRAMMIQYEESDYDFVTRILAREGVFIHLSPVDNETTIQLADDVTRLPHAETDITLRFAANAGAAKDDEHVSAVSRIFRQSPADVVLSDTDPWGTTDLSAAVTVPVATALGEAHHWAPNEMNPERLQALAERMAAVHTWQAETLRLDTTVRAVQPGMLLELVDHPTDSGRYRILSVDQNGSQRAAAGNGLGGKDDGYCCKLTVIPVAIPYVPAYQRRAPVFTSFTGCIEEEVDERGLYRVRLPFDQRGNADGPASPPTRLMQTLGGEDHGMHFPLARGTEVNINFENGDLDRPIIVGALYNRNAVNPVTDANARQNLIQTRSGHRFLLDDTPQKERIELATPDTKNHLTLNAEQENHKVTLETLEGDAYLFAGKSMTLESGTDQTTTVGANHNVHVKGDQSLQTQEGSIRVESAEDIEYSAKGSIRWQSREGDITLTSGVGMHWQVGDGLYEQVDAGNYQIQVLDGSLNVEAARDITFNGLGSGAITLKQSDGTLQIDSGGNLTLTGPAVEITADTIAIKGGTVSNN